MRESFRGRRAAIFICIPIFLSEAVIGKRAQLSTFGPLKGVRIFGNNLFGFCDTLVSDFLMVLGSLLFAVFAGWKMKKEEVLPEVGNNRIIYCLMKWVAPVTIVIIFFSNLLLK